MGGYWLRADIYLYQFNDLAVKAVVVVVVGRRVVSDSNRIVGVPSDRAFGLAM